MYCALVQEVLSSQINIYLQETVFPSVNDDDTYNIIR